MLDAYEPLIILEKFPLYIESITAYGENLVVGTKQGHLLMYGISSDTTNRIKINLLRSNKNFSRKPINQIAVVPEHQILISLSDQAISVHDLTVFNFPLMMTLPKTKGAVAFDLDIKHHTSLTGEAVVTIRLVVAVRRKLQLYYWKARQFHDLRDELTLPDSPRCLMWIGEAVAVGFKHDYWIVKLTGEQKELFATGKTQEPLITKMPDNSLALSRDETTILVDKDGNSTCSYTIEWPEQPIAMTYDEPYLIAVMLKCIQIQSLIPKLNIQRLDLEKPRLITSTVNSKNQKHVFIASVNNIWCLHPVSVNQQIPQLLLENQFELALKLVDLSNESRESKLQMKQHIEKRNALHLFCEGQFKEAMKYFNALNTDLLFVIGLYPGLVPEEYRNKLQNQHSIPELEEDKMTEALQELIHFLLQTRHKITIAGDKGENGISGSIKSKSQQLQIIDTTLLKCHLKNNDTLIVPFLKKPDVQVNLEEAERVLRQAQKYSELVLLLKTRGLHSRALQLLLRHSKRKDSPLRGHIHTVKYLQELGPSHIELIFEYGGWVLKSHPQDGLKIFIGEDSLSESVELLPRPRVLNFIKKANNSIVIPYLEHIIWEWGDKTPLIHNELIYQYIDMIINSEKYSEDNTSSPIKHKKDVREKLKKFLKVSSAYTAATILVNFPQNDLFEEKAILLGRLGQHQHALKLYINVLDDVEGAIEYCHCHYSPSGHGSKVYIILIKLLTGASTSASNSRNNSPSIESLRLNKNYIRNEKIVFNILNSFAHCIDIEQAMKYFPDDMSIGLLKSYIHKSLIHLSTISKENQVSRGLSEALGGQATAELSVHHQKKIEISDQTVCYICLKKFTTSW